VNTPSWLKTYLRWSIGALAFSVSFGVALVSISKLLIVIGFMCLVFHDSLTFLQQRTLPSKNTTKGLFQDLRTWGEAFKAFVERFKPLLTPKAVLLALLWMGISVLWTEASPAEWPIALNRHSRILFIPLILYCIRSKEDVLTTVRVMVLAQLSIVLYSYLLWLGAPLPFSNPLYPKDFGVVINGHLEQPIMTTLMVILAWSFRRELWPRLPQGFTHLVCALGAFNVFFIMTGRTGFIAMLLAITLGLYQYVKLRHAQFKIWIWVLPLVMACALGLLSNRFNQKVLEAFHDISLYQQGNDATSQGYRLDYWRQSLKSISDAAVVGHGAGSWRHEYISHGGNEPNAPTNPHQQFLLWTVESGLVGLALLMAFYAALFRDAQRLQGPSQDAMMSTLGIVVMVSLFNCPFYGAGIGEFFILIFASMLAMGLGPAKRPVDLTTLRAHPEQLSWVERLGLRVVSQPLSVAVDGNEHEYAQSEGLGKLGWRQLRKICYLHLHGQAPLQRQLADPQWRRGLWIYQRTPQIGDSLMDLAPRNLFAANGIEMDLMVPDHLRKLFSGDPAFKNIYSSPSPELYGPYDFVVVQSIHHRSLYKKIKHFPQLPWVCVQGDYDVPNFARSRFATQRLCDLFNWSLSEPMFTHHATQKLIAPSTPEVKAMNSGPSQHGYALAIALGGMDPSRIYFQWPKVLTALQGLGFKHCLLIGAGEQAQATSDEMIATLGSAMKIESLVNQVSLDECRTLLAQTELLITADGGLMHMGVASGCKRIISLFTKSIAPSYRLTTQYLGDAIQSSSDLINDIDPERIVHRVLNTP